jgi:dynein heavy chain
MATRHTTMVVGPTGAGKSVIIDTLAKSRKEWTGGKTDIYTINPKMITTRELYGVLDPESRDWTDGLLSKTFKEMNTDLAPGKEQERRWILYDGDVDAVWVENMNSVMDDNRILTLANGDRIRLLKHCSMLFEVFDLQYASPATISRCGMVYVDPKNLGYQPFYERWVKTKTKMYGETIGDNLRDLYAKYIEACIERIFEGNTGEELVEPFKFITPRTTLNVIQQLCDLVDSMMPAPDQNPNDEFDKMDKFYIFCIIWSLGGCLVVDDREKFNQFVVGLAQQVLPQNSLYDNYFDIGKMGFMKWDDLVPIYEAPADRKFGSILVPTVDTVKYAWLLNRIMLLKKPAMFCGDSGTAKTVTVQSQFKSLDSDKYMILNINFSSRTSSLDFQNIIEENIDKKTFK